MSEQNTDVKSLAHTKWNCKYHIVFAPKYRRKVFYNEKKEAIREIGITGSQVGIVLTAMSVAAILFRPVAGYLLDNFNRYHVYLVFLALFCLSFTAFLLFPVFGLLIIVRLYMEAVSSVCGSAIMTLAGDVLPSTKITEGISRFAFTISIGMAVGPYVGIQVQNYMSSKVSFMTVFAITVIAFICVFCCRLHYPKVEKKKFSLKGAFYKPAIPFICNMMFLMIPYGAVTAYSSILAQEKNLMSVLPYFYIFLVVGMLISKISTQKVIDAGQHFRTEAWGCEWHIYAVLYRSGIFFDGFYAGKSRINQRICFDCDCLCGRCSRVYCLCGQILQQIKRIMRSLNDS